MAQEKFEERLGEVADVLEDILDDCNTELTGKGAEEASNLNAVPSKIRSIPQGGGGASTWSEIENKPFETIGSGLSVDGQGVLSATGGGAGGADWNAQEGEAGFIENKPFDVETVEVVLSDYTLQYNAEYSDMGHPFYGTFDDAAPIQNLTSPTTISVYYNDIEVDETIVDFSGILVSQSYLNYMIQGIYENPVIALLNQGGAWVFAVMDDNLPSQEGSSITVSVNKASITRLNADKINLAPSLLSDNGKLTINTSATYSGAGTGGTIITGGLGTAQNDCVGLSLGNGLTLNEDESILYRVNDLFTDYVYDANTSTDFGHTTYICELPSSSYTYFPKLGLALCGVQFGVYYNDTIYKTSPMCIVGNDAFLSENLLNFYMRGTPLQSPSLEFMISAGDMGIIMYIINDDLPAEEGATLHTSISSPHNTGYSAVDLMPATQAALGGIKAYFDNSTNTLYIRTDNQDAQPSGN